MENKEIARLLWETADLMEIAAEDGFRIRSYRNGATAVEGYPERIVDILRDPERKVTDIPGIGKGLAGVLAEIAERGSCERRDQLLEKFPPGALEFLKIQGLGPKSIALIFEHFHIGTIDELERLCQEQKLRGLPRMGAKLEEKVLRSIAGYRQRTGRYLLSYAEGVAAELSEILRKVPGVDSRHARRQPAARTRNRGRSRSAGHRAVSGRARSRHFLHTRGWTKCSPAARIRPAPKWAAKACRWTSAPCRRRVLAPPCNTSPAARTTTWPFACAP